MADAPPIPLARRANADGSIELDLAVSPDLLWFAGHFPGRPILPGVVLLHWAAGLARRHLGADLPAAREFQVKFKAVVRPGDILTLILAHDPAKRRIGLEYRCGDTVCCGGWMALP